MGSAGRTAAGSTSRLEALGVTNLLPCTLRHRLALTCSAAISQASGAGKTRILGVLRLLPLILHLVVAPRHATSMLKLLSCASVPPLSDLALHASGRQGCVSGPVARIPLLYRIQAPLLGTSVPRGLLEMAIGSAC